NSGTSPAPLTPPRLTERWGWRGVFPLAAIPVSLAWVAFAVLAKEPPRPKPALGVSSNPFSLLDDPDARWLCSFYLVTFGGFVGLASYLPIFFVDHFGLTKFTAGGFAALCAVAGSFLRPLGGLLSDRLGGTRVLAISLAGASILLLGVATLPGLPLTVLFLFAAMGAFGMGNGSVFQLVPQRFPARMGAMTGLVGAAGGVGGFLLPFALGSLKGSTGSFTAGFAVVAMAVGTASYYVNRRQRVWATSWDIEVAV
ncbi:MAG: MFS transporter, partial [Acidimicrobiales bacterium]